MTGPKLTSPMPLMKQDLDMGINRIIRVQSPKRPRDAANKKYTDDHGFIDRGDPALVDFNKAALTIDGTWRDLDLSTIIPVDNKVDIKAVLIKVIIVTGDKGNFIKFRKKGNSNEKTASVITNQVSDVEMNLDMTVPLDTNRFIQYKAENVTFTIIRITVKGWYY